MGTKKNPGEFDCYEAAEDDEPMFVLLARDESAPDLVESWARLRKLRIAGERPDRAERDLEKVNEALECAAAMRRWHAKNR